MRHTHQFKSEKIIAHQFHMIFLFCLKTNLRWVNFLLTSFKLLGAVSTCSWDNEVCNSYCSGFTVVRRRWMQSPPIIIKAYCTHENLIILTSDSKQTTLKSKPKQNSKSENGFQPKRFYQRYVTINIVSNSNKKFCPF